jgi:hypothetical protein
MPCHSKKLHVIIHSSSHLGAHRGVANRVKTMLRDDFHVRIEAWGGRKWDETLIKRVKEINEEDKEPKLHIILLGDNDLRATHLSDPVNPKIKKFGKAIGKLKDPFKFDNIFVNGLLPFPIFYRPNSCELIENFFRYTQELSGLFHYSPSIYYIPMRESVKEFCELKRVSKIKLFKSDMVHLTKLGEEFLVNHLTRQARMYKAAVGRCVSPTDLVFFQNVANLDRKKIENTKTILKEYNLDSSDDQKSLETI